MSIILEDGKCAERSDVKIKQTNGTIVRSSVNRTHRRCIERLQSGRWNV